MRAKKTEKRIMVIDEIMDALTSKEVYTVIDTRSASEDKIKTYLHQTLLKHLAKIYQDIFGEKADLAEKHAKKSLLWESDKNTTINNVEFLGTQHRPDFVIQVNELDIAIAIELKIGESGQSIREGLGQCLVYASSKFDFVCYLFADSSSDKKIAKSIDEDPEKAFLAELWNDYNIRFAVVGYK